MSKKAKEEDIFEVETEVQVSINPLRKERIIVRRIPKLSGIWGNNPKHVLSGGMADSAVKRFVVPKLSSGLYVNVLTDKEKDFLEEALGLEKNAMSIFKKTDNFWSDANPSGINIVSLKKGDNYFDLSLPEDYIKYKILLANKDYIAASMQILEDKPKETYQFVIISEGEETKMAKTSMNTTMQCYKEFGKIEDNKDKLRFIVEVLTTKPTSQDVKLEYLQTKMNELIQLNNKTALKVMLDPLLDTKVLIKKSIEAGLISNRGGYLYLREDGSPLCENGEEPTMNIAAKFLNAAKNQSYKFNLESKLSYNE